MLRAACVFLVVIATCGCARDNSVKGEVVNKITTYRVTQYEHQIPFAKFPAGFQEHPVFVEHSRTWYLDVYQPSSRGEYRAEHKRSQWVEVTKRDFDRYKIGDVYP